ncbi:MAG: LptF/LptG family permease [Myxococcota bacterium]
MSRLDRYLARETLVPLAFASVFVVVVVFLFQAQRLMGAALGLGLTLTDALIIFGAALPPFLVLAIPIAYLLSVLVALGRLGQDRELVALLASGASPLRIARVPVLIGLLVSAVSLPIAHFGEPYGLRLLYTRLVDVGLRNISEAIRPGVFNEDFSDMALYASGKTEGGELQNLLLFDERDPKRPMLIVAAKGRLVPTAGTSLAFELTDGEVHLGKGGERERYERMRFHRMSLGVDAKREILERTRFVSELGQATTSDMWIGYHQRPGSLWSKRVEKAFWRRFAFPLMSLIFGLLGAAIALSARPDARARIAIFGVLSVVLYYVLMRAGDFLILGDHDHAFIGAWIPNLVMIVLGVYGLRRAGRARS